MKRRKVLLYWSVLQATISLIGFLTLFVVSTDAAIVPPPWSDPEKNPCASMPGGWQLLYWPPLKKCFKIFTIGFPCPDTLELSPTVTVGNRKSSRDAPAAECRCPPGTALSAETNKCHEIFKRGPCEKEGQYFSPIFEGSGSKKSLANHRGSCKMAPRCPDDMIFWPKDAKCYTKFTKGPCAKGKLLVLNDDQLGECKCENTGVLSDYYHNIEETCHEHFTKGPCSTPGHLFLPGGRCDCQRHLPHYYDEHQMCFELNSPGPCPPGHIFNIPDNFTNAATTLQMPRARCQCKDGYIPWSNGHCYRLYTRGPCGPNEFLINATTCIRNFCTKGQLYFPDQNTCYRIGSQGPCDLNKVVVFDFTARPSVDGISYNGMCGCSGVIKFLHQKCSESDEMNEAESNVCEATPGMVELNGNCYKLYSRGPCGAGQWLEPLKTQIVKTQRFLANKAKCVCRPGYTRADDDDAYNDQKSDSQDAISQTGNTIMGLQRCNAPSVGLARWFIELFGKIW